MHKTGKPRHVLVEGDQYCERKPLSDEKGLHGDHGAHQHMWLASRLRKQGGRGQGRDENHDCSVDYHLAGREECPKDSVGYG
ncbi:hypothetical protein ACHAXR_004992 [Thalassiosira sp. AJA248-18]